MWKDIKDYELFEDHTVITFVYQKNDYQVVSPLQGEYNVYNLCAAILALLCLNYEMDDIITRINRISIKLSQMSK